jgi:hypothetical protein
VDTFNKIENLSGQIHITWSRARTLHILVDCAGVRSDVESTGYIVIISCKKIKMSLHGECRTSYKHLKKSRKKHVLRYFWVNLEWTITYETRCIRRVTVSDTTRTPTLIIKLNCVIFFKLLLTLTCQCSCRVLCPCLCPSFI